MVKHLNIPAWQRSAGLAAVLRLTSRSGRSRYALYGRASRGIGRGNGRATIMYLLTITAVHRSPRPTAELITWRIIYTHITIILLFRIGTQHVLLLYYLHSVPWSARHPTTALSPRVYDKAVSIISPMFISPTFDGFNTALLTAFVCLFRSSYFANFRSFAIRRCYT